MPKPRAKTRVADYKERLNAAQKAQHEQFFNDADVTHLLHARSQLIDDLLREIWLGLRFPKTLALLAVGGYGRGELWTASDIDILLLLPKASPSASLSKKIEHLISVFWDIGLVIGHSVRTLDECLAATENDLTAKTALLEARPLIGNQTLVADLLQQFHQQFHIQSFFHGKRSEQSERYRQYQESPNSLEPNCKESPGGLRDLQTILWISKAAGRGKSWHELHLNGFITHQEALGLKRREIFLQRIRAELHLHTQRHEDRLLFDYQTALAEKLGFHTTKNQLASERLMQEYYRTAKTIMQLNIVLLQNLGAVIFPLYQESSQVINAHFLSFRQLVELKHEDLFNQNPHAIFELFALLQAHPELKGLTARTTRALWRARTLVDENFRKDAFNKSRFIEFFKAPHGVLHGLQRMNQFDILGRYLPKFGAIVGQMQHDLFHAYTVDQHSMQVLRNLRRFSNSEFTHEYPFCSQLINDFERPWLLYIAALFHDIAKGRGGGHAELGAHDAQDFCRSHALNAEDSELIVWLVRHHLVMSNIAQKKDISDLAVLSAFAEQVGDERHLSALYLFTVADIRATSPKVWNTWKGQLLKTLYQHTLPILLAGKTPEKQSIKDEKRHEAKRLLQQIGLTEHAPDALWQQLDSVYFQRHSAEEIAWHARALHASVNSAQPIVKVRSKAPVHDVPNAASNAPNTQAHALEIMVFARDQPDLFMRLAGFFSRAGYNIADAKIHTTRHGYALDSFMLLDVGARFSEPYMMNYIEHELTLKLSQANAPEVPPNKRVSRQLRHFPLQPSVTIEGDEKGTHFVLSVSAADRPGLLYAVAKTLAAHGIRLHTAKIATLGERVEDTFQISGGALNDSSWRVKLETQLLEELQSD